MAVSRFVLLNTGARMPSLGLGTFLLKGASCKEIVDRALFLGYRHIDTAVSYENDKDIGEVIKDRLHSGLLKRNDVFVTTKVPVRKMDKDDVGPCVEEALERLKLPYVDMLLMHSPYALKNRGDNFSYPNDKDLRRGEYVHQDLCATWNAMENAVKQNHTKAIGISNFTVPQLEQVIKKSSIMPSNLQMECHVFCQQRKLRTFCQSKGIVVTAYSPLGAGGRPAYYVEPGDLEVMEDPVVKKIAQEVCRNPGQVLLRFLFQQGLVPLPKTSSFERLQENWQVYDFSLNNGQMQSLAELNQNQKYFRFPWAEGHPEYTNYKDEPF